MKALSKAKAAVAKGLPYLAWASFAFAAVGGALLPGTPVGQGIAELIHSITWAWLPAVAFAAMVVGIALDIARDMIPNRIAVYSAAAAPTVAGAISGKLAGAVTGFAQWMASWMTAPLREWSGIYTSTGLAVLALALSYVVAKRVVKDGKATGKAGA